jgi:hypothetical protein
VELANALNHWVGVLSRGSARARIDGHGNEPAERVFRDAEVQVDNKDRTDKNEFKTAQRDAECQTEIGTGTGDGRLGILPKKGNGPRGSSRTPTSWWEIL